MNKLYSIIKRFVNRQRLPEDPALFCSTAAVPSAEEAEALHKGKRRLKENYTSHWDLDYLPREDVDKILQESAYHEAD